MVESWKVSVDGKTSVEVSSSDLTIWIQNGHLSKNTLVWREGMTGWVEIDEVPFLKSC